MKIQYSTIIKNVNMKVKLIFSVLTVFMYSSIVSGDVSVRVFSCDEALSSTNMSKPRIYIHNNGTEQINNCSYRYYFSIENSKVPVLDNYYTPDETVTLEHIEDSLYRLVYTVNRTINPGENAPYPPGNSVGLHYNDWSAWDKSNDYSNNMQSTSTENNTIAVYVDGVRVYGTEPVDSGGDPPDSSIQLSSFALYSTEKSIVKDRSIFNGGGAIGSNGYVEIGDSSEIYGNIVSGGDALLRSHAQIFGDVTVGDSVTIESGVSVSGIIEENAEAGILSLPQKVISPGYNNVTVNQGQTVSISPGIYKDVLVMTGGTLNLEPGNYVFRDFILQTDADVIFNMDPVELLEIDIQRNMEIADRAKLQFSDYAYAPSVQIYTNDSDTLRIGCDAVISGILIAPHATVTIFSRAQCDGAVYAKVIIIEPDAELFSGLVDPEGDYDGDGLSNYTEIFATHTDPRDPNSFVSMAIPSPSKINNTTQTTVTYDPSVFYGANYSHGKISVTFGANSLINSTVAPPLYISNTPTGTHDTTAENDPPNIPGYETVGNYLRLPENTMDSSGNVRVGFLLPLNEILGPENFVCSYKGDNGEWAVAEVEAEVSETGSIEENVYKVYVDLNRFSSLVLMRKRISVTAYLDNGMILSNNSNEAKISANILVLVCPLLSDAFFRVYYTEEGDTAEKSVEMELEPYVLPDMYHYGNDKVFSFQENITVTRFQWHMDTILDYTYDVNYSVQKGECLKLGMCLPLSYCMEYEDHISASNTIPFEMESVDIDGEGRIYHTSTSGFKYDCYIKDHLGSTRMVVNDENVVTEAFAYQPYGTIIPLDDIAATPQTPTRQQFTGKEFDREGEDSENGVSGIQAYYFGARYYDPEIGVWLSTDPAEEFFNPYAYHTNPISFIDPTGEDFGLSAAIVGAIIAAAVATTTTTVSAVQEYQQTGNWDWGDYLKDVFIQSNIAGSIGFVTGGFGAGISSGISSGIQAAGGSAFAGATAGGAAAGAFGGATSYTMNYIGQSAFGYQDWGTGQDFLSGLGKSTLLGGVIGGGTAAAQVGLDRLLGNIDEGTLVYQHSSEGDGTGVVNDLKGHFKERALNNPNARGSHLRFESDKLNIDWGAAADKVSSSRLRVTGLNLNRASKVYSNYKPSVAQIAKAGNVGRNFNPVFRNCGQVVQRTLRQRFGSFTPAGNYGRFYLRQVWRNALGI